MVMLVVDSGGGGGDNSHRGLLFGGTRRTRGTRR